MLCRVDRPCQLDRALDRWQPRGCGWIDSSGDFGLVMTDTGRDSWSWRLRSCHALMHKPSFVFVSGCEGWHEEGGASEAISEAISSGFSSKEVCNWVLMCRRPHRVSCIPTIPNSGRTFGFISLFELSVILASCWQGPLKRDFLYWKKRWLSILTFFFFFLKEATVRKNRKAFCIRLFSVKNISGHIWVKSLACNVRKPQPFKQKRFKRGRVHPLTSLRVT